MPGWTYRDAVEAARIRFEALWLDVLLRWGDMEPTITSWLEQCAALDEQEWRAQPVGVRHVYDALRGMMEGRA